MLGINTTPYYIEQDREKAIHLAISHTQTKDILIIAGKGHEKTQIIQDKAYYFSDQESVKKRLAYLKT